MKEKAFRAVRLMKYKCRVVSNGSVWVRSRGGWETSQQRFWASLAFLSECPCGLRLDSLKALKTPHRTRAWLWNKYQDHSWIVFKLNTICESCEPSFHIFSLSNLSFFPLMPASLCSHHKRIFRNGSVSLLYESSEPENIWRITSTKSLKTERVFLGAVKLEGNLMKWQKSFKWGGWWDACLATDCKHRGTQKCNKISNKRMYFEAKWIFMVLYDKQVRRNPPAMDRTLCLWNISFLHKIVTVVRYSMFLRSTSLMINHGISFIHRIGVFQLLYRWCAATKWNY